MPLPAGSPQAFQAAVDQAKMELAQVEPRVPKLVVQVTPANANPQLLIDGQSVSAALIGEPLPLDPGTHRVRVVAQGFSSSDQDAVLRERETTTVVATLRPVADSAPPSNQTLPPPPPPPLPTSGATQPPPGAPPPYIPPPPPRIAEREVTPSQNASRLGILAGAHIGWAIGTGGYPVGVTKVEASMVAGGGPAYGLEGGLRFARHWYVGLMFEHAELTHGDLSPTPEVKDASSSTNVLAAMIAFIVNPDRTSFYVEAGGATRWFDFTEKFRTGRDQTGSYNGVELDLGIGLWLPLGNSVRLLPKMTVGIGNFETPLPLTGLPNSQGHAFFLLGLTGLYNLDF